MSKRGHSLEDKIKIIKAIKDEDYSIYELESIFNVNNLSIYDWVYKYEKYGVEGLKESSTWRRYSKELKLEAVKEYLDEGYSLGEVTRRYEIPSTTTLRQWIKKYNSYRELKDTSKGRTSSMTKGRKTTWHEWIQIVLDCLGNAKDYQRKHVAENVLNREFTLEKPNEKWVTDVTEFKYAFSKKAYLSAILDLYDGSIVSYVLGHSNNYHLV